MSDSPSHMDDDEWQLRWVRVPEGTHLSRSRATPGRERDLLREDGTNKTLGPTESVPADEGALYGGGAYVEDQPSGPGRTELTWGQQLAADVIRDVVRSIDWEAVFEQHVAPAVRRHSVKVRTRIRSAVGRVRRRRRPDTAELVPDEESAELDTLADSTRVSMTGEEYRQRVVSALAAEAYASWQRGILANAHIADDVDPELIRGVELVLEGKLASVEEETLLTVMEFLEGAREAERALELPRGESREDRGDAHS